MANVLEVNKKVDLEVKEGAYKGSFKSRIEEVTAGEVMITTPLRKGEYVPLRVGTRLNLLVYDDSAICSFSCVITARKKGTLPVLVLKLPQKYKRIQRRNFYRLKIKLPLFYRPLPLEDEEGEDFREGEMIDISGGGLQMKFIHDEAFPISARLELKVQIPELGELPLKGKIVSRFLREGDSYVGIQFFHITTQLQDDIVGWIFTKMRTMRKKGLL